MTENPFETVVKTPLFSRRTRIVKEIEDQCQASGLPVSALNVVTALYALGYHITPREAKLYYFNPNSYSTEWFVAAYSREEAITAVEEHIRAEVAAERFYDDDPADYAPENLRHVQTAEEKRAERLGEELRCLQRYVTATPWLHSSRDPAPCIEEHPIGKVIQTEIS